MCSYLHVKEKSTVVLLPVHVKEKSTVIRITGDPITGVMGNGDAGSPFSFKYRHFI